jgi:hypothetical protein
LAVGDGELVFSLRLHQLGFWLVAPVQVFGFRELEMVLDTGSPANSLSKSVLAALLDRKLICPTSSQLGRRPTYFLSNASVEEQALPDLEVYLSNRVSMLPIDGILGLAFLSQFRHVALDVPTLRLTLRS